MVLLAKKEKKEFGIVKLVVFQVSHKMCILKETLCFRTVLEEFSLCQGANQPTLAWTPMRNVCSLCSALSPGHPLLHDLDTVNVCVCTNKSGAEEFICRMKLKQKKKSKVVSAPSCLQSHSLS